MAPRININEDFLLRVFAGDISRAPKGNSATDVSEAANQLARILHMVLKAIGLTLSIEKCKNFLIQAGSNALRLLKRGYLTLRWFKTKERVRLTAAETKVSSEMKRREKQKGLLPYQEIGSFKLLGMALGDCWAFHGHLESMLAKLRVRKAVLRKVRN